MSYILDALQRAEAERERERSVVPGLQTRSIAPAGVTDQPMLSYAMRRALAAALALAMVLALGLWLWRTPWGGMPTPVAAVPDAPANMPAPSAAIVPTPLKEGTRTVTTVTAPVLASKPPPPEPALPRPPESKKVAEVPPAKTVAAGGAKGSIGVPLFKDMPEEFRRQVPALAISGAVYSENPAQRLLLVNGQVLSQGSPAAQDVTLEEIHPTTSEFSFKGSRFRLPH